MRKLITPHLAFSEVQCRDGCGLGARPPEFIDPYTASLYELIREACGGNPLYITSGWRCISHNKKVGGHPKSLHLLGMSLDIAKPKLISLDEFYHIADEIVGENGGVGLYPSQEFIHIDCGTIIGLKPNRRWTK